MIKIKSKIDISLVQTALKNHRDSIGKVTLPRHYINEIRLIYFAVVGNSKPPQLRRSQASLPRNSSEIRSQITQIKKPLNPRHWEGGFARALVEADTHILRSSQCFGNAALIKDAHEKHSCFEINFKDHSIT
jgi:hypothetical protein